MNKLVERIMKIKSKSVKMILFRLIFTTTIVITISSVSVTTSANAEVPDLKIKNFTHSGKGEVVVISDNTADLFLYSGNNQITLDDYYSRLVINYDSEDDIDKLLEVNLVYDNELTSEIIIGQLRNKSNFMISGQLENQALKRVSFKGEYQDFNLEKYSFSDCECLKHIVFPEKCDTINVKEQAFINVGLESIEFPFYSNIKYHAFDKCDSLENITFKNGCDIDVMAFIGCSALKNVSFNGKCNVDAAAFKGCKLIENIDISDETVLSDTSFNDCEKLMTINSENIFDIERNDIIDKYKPFVYANFAGSENVGFINEYIKLQTKKIVAENTTPQMKDIEKVSALHNWICNKVEYDINDIYAASNHSDASVILSEYSVCEGYARFYNLLLHEAGIETCYVASSDHAWNIIKLGDHYFHSDTTWDDMSSSYQWFLKSDSELKKAGGSHASWELSVPSKFHEFQTQTMPVCDYSIGDVNSDGSINAADLISLSRFLHGKQNENFDIILSDLDYSGQIDVFDLIHLRKRLIIQ